MTAAGGCLAGEKTLQNRKLAENNRSFRQGLALYKAQHYNLCEHIMAETISNPAAADDGECSVNFSSAVGGGKMQLSNLQLFIKGDHYEKGSTHPRFL